jgi:hypothetical protein
MRIDGDSPILEDAIKSVMATEAEDSKEIERCDKISEKLQKEMIDLAEKAAKELKVVVTADEKKKLESKVHDICFDWIRTLEYEEKAWTVDMP